MRATQSPLATLPAGDLMSTSSTALPVATRIRPRSCRITRPG